MRKSAEIKKIFVVGRHRTGTTWVANILASHAQVFTPTHEAHRGQHESEFFSSVVPYCRLGETQTDRMAIRAIFERSDFWQLLFPESSPSLDVEELGIHGYFSAAMDEATLQRGCTHWLEKTPAHTLVLGDLVRAYPDAIFIAVERDSLDTTRSNVHRFADANRWRDWLKAAVWHEVYSKILSRHRDRVHVVRYADLVNCYDKEMSTLMQVVGLNDQAHLQSSWAPNTSFGGDVPEVPTKYRLLVRAISILFRYVPASFCELVARNRVRKLDKPLPNWFFRVFSGRSDGPVT